MATKRTGQDVDSTGSEDWKGCQEGGNLHFLSIYLPYSDNMPGALYV